MTATAAQHDAHLDAEQAAGDLAEELAARWHEITGLPADPPPSVEDEEALPIDPERATA